jgi:tRNA-binding EMAP/Myf-like protein
MFQVTTLKDADSFNIRISKVNEPVDITNSRKLRILKIKLAPIALGSYQDI